MVMHANVFDIMNLKTEPFHSVKELDLIIYWTTMLVLIIANFFAVIVIIPFLFFASNFYFFFIVAVLGLLFGYVFSLLIHNVENIGMHHHLMALLFIPIFAVFNLIVMTTSVGAISAAIGFESNKDPATISIFYAVFFVLPYFISAARKRHFNLH